MGVEDKAKQGSFENPIVLEKFEDFENVESEKFINIKGNAELFLGSLKGFKEEFPHDGKMYMTLLQFNKGLVLEKSYISRGDLKPIITEIINHEREPIKYLAYANKINLAKQKNA